MRINYSVALFAALSLLPQLGNAALPTPVIHYAFDDAYDADASTTATESIGGLDAIWGNSNSIPDWDEGILGGSVRFHGGGGPFDDNFFRTPELTPLLGDASRPGFSISAWINPGSSGQSETKAVGFSGIVTTRSATLGTQLDSYLGLNLEQTEVPGSDPVAYEVHIDARSSVGAPGGSLATDSPADSISVDNAVGELGGWYHIVYVAENADFATTVTSNLWIYINGQAVTVNDFGGSFLAPLSAAGIWSIGSDSLSNERIFEGRIDDLAFYDSPLSATQAAEIFSQATTSGVNAVGTPSPMPPPPGILEAILENYGDQVFNGREGGDLNFDGDVDAKDWRLFKDHLWPATLTASIPEPGSAPLLVLAVLIGGMQTARTPPSSRPDATHSIYRTSTH